VPERVWAEAEATTKEKIASARIANLVKRTPVDS
jgi:hypothetical protein